MANKDKLWRRANNYGNAELLEFQRHIKNKELREDVRKTRTEASLPLSLKSGKVFFEDPTYIDWMGWEELNEAVKSKKDKRRRKVIKRVRGILDKYKIPSHFFGSLFDFVVTGESTHSYQTKGFPYFVHGADKFQSNDFAEWKYLCIITPETDLENPLVLENIKEWQLRYKNIPPQPIIVGRKKDWMPVWEWRKRNPDVSIGEIAKLLKVHRVTVSRALNQLDKVHTTK
jgi:hypothetical protein